MGSDLATAGDGADTSFGKMGEGAHKVSGQMRETREALRGLGEEIGVTMPRFVSSWLASLGGVSTVMAAAFAPIAVIGLIEVLGKIPGALEKGIDWLHGWTAEAKKAFAATAHDELEWEMRTIRMDERLRAIALIGVEGMKKWGLEATINSKNYDEVKNKVAELNQALIENAAIAARPQGAKALMGETDLSKLQMGPSHEEIDKAKTNVKELGPIIKELSARLDDLGIKTQEITAQTGAAAKEMAAKWQESIQKQTEALATAAQHRIIEELKAHREEEAEATRYREHIEEEGEKVSAGWVRELVETLKKQREAAAAAAKEIGELQQRLAAEGAKSLEEEHRALDAKVNLEEAALDKTKKEYQQKMDLEEQIRAAGHAKIDRDNQAAYAGEIARLDEHLKQIESKNETSQQRIVSAYKADVEKINAAEQEETVKKSLSEAQRAEVATRYAAIRAALLKKEQTELQELKNSQGFHGVFGAGFAEMIRGNEALAKEWAQSTDQAGMLVKVSLEGLKETAEETFKSFAAGMGASIESAVIHSKSIKEAMKAETESVLEALAAQATVHAIASLALGFEDEAKNDYKGASAAFTAAAIWGSAAVAATVGGRAMAGSGGSGSASGAGAGGSGGGAATGQGVGGTAAGQGGPHVTVNVQGHLVGWAHMGELTAALSDAVVNSGVKLTATNTTTGEQVIR
jgi:hypothetical protein